MERHAGELHPHTGSHLGELLAETLVERGWLVREDRDFRITPAGRAGLKQLGVDAGTLE